MAVNNGLLVKILRLFNAYHPALDSAMNSSCRSITTLETERCCSAQCKAMAISSALSLAG
jgi:hypothetical protein